MDLLASKNVSLACVIINIFIALTSFAAGNWAWAIVSVALAAFCYNNYRNAE